MTERAKKLLLLYYKQSRKIRRVSGLPPLTFKAKKAGTLKNYRIYGNTEIKTRSYSGAAPLSFPIADGSVSNYRIYGNTVNGESVGELVTDSQSEHYGKYAILITNNSENTIIYLDEPLRKVGDEAEYVDYAEQKRYNADGTNEDVTLPALPAQSSTNSLSVGTTIQPSSVAVDVDEVVSCGDMVTDSQSVNYGKYKIPVTLTADSAETTDIYLDEPLRQNRNYADYIDYGSQKVTRKIKRKTFTGNETFWLGSLGELTTAVSERFISDRDRKDNVKNNYFEPIEYASLNNQTIIGTNLRLITSAQLRDYAALKFVYKDSNGSAIAASDFKSLLAEWYANGNPLVVDYIVETPVEEQITLPAISTLAGTNTLTVGTEVQPSGVEIKGRIKAAGGD